jgi:hypothetical protein
MNDGNVPATYVCANIKNNSPVVCAGASDDCRFNGSSWTSTEATYTTD